MPAYMWVDGGLELGAENIGVGRVHTGLVAIDFRDVVRDLLLSRVSLPGKKAISPSGRGNGHQG